MPTYSSYNSLGSTIEQDEITEGAITDKELNSDDLSENKIQIIELQANAGITPLDHDSIICETFSDADGYLNSVNTGNSTATHDTNKYKRENVADAEQQDFTTQTNNVGYSGKSGGNTYRYRQQFIASSNYTIKGVNIRIDTGAGTPTGLKVALHADNSDTIGSEITTGSLADASITEGARNNITFASAQALTSGTKYWLLFTDSNEAGLADGNYYSLVGDTANANGWIADYYNGSWNNNNSNLINMASLIEGTHTKKVIEIDLPSTITGEVTASQLIVNDVERETGDDITYDIIDSASDEDTDLSLDTKNTLTTPDGTKIVSGKIKINLEPKTGTATDGYPSVKSFALKLWKS